MREEVAEKGPRQAAGPFRNPEEDKVSEALLGSWSDITNGYWEENTKDPGLEFSWKIVRGGADLTGSKQRWDHSGQGVKALWGGVPTSISGPT